MNNIKKLRNKFGINQTELGNKIGLSARAIGFYESSDRDIPTSKLQKIADYFNVSTDYVLGRSNDLQDDVKQIPLLGKIAAGYPTTMFADVIDYIDIPADMARGNKELFALKTKGKSMEPNFIEGDILIFEKTEDCENGQFCAVAVNGDDATFKKVTKTDTGIMLQPLNPDFETKFYTNEQIASLPVQIIGVLKQIRRNF
nr:MAG TPA: Repressor protein CI [Caudoviricetes sp.]